MTQDNNRPQNRANRRTFLKTVGAGIGGLTIPSVVGAASSEDLVEIVHTRDVHDNPVKVRKISKERYRRIQTFKEITPQSIGKQGLVTGFRLVGEGDDLRIIAQIPKSASTVDPSSVDTEEYNGVPIQYERADTEKREKCREGTHYDTIEGGIEVGVKDSRWLRNESRGTCSFVAWNANPDNPFKCAVTAAHIVENRADGDLYQPRPSDSNSRVIGSFYELSPSDVMDGAKYDLSESSNPLETVDSQQEDITGYWTFEGITDQTSQGYTIPCTFSGASTCSQYYEADHASKSMLLDYQVNFDRAVTQSGDSGGPFVDGDGKLLSILTGEMEYDKDGDNEVELFDFGPAAGELLNYINVVLGDPSNL
jgi:hypothetical protein